MEEPKIIKLSARSTVSVQDLLASVLQDSTADEQESREAADE